MENRYEEYSSFPDGLPFICMPRLHRSAINLSREANWHENLEIQLCVAGDGSVLLDGRRILFSPGETVVVNSGVIHHTRTESELCYSCLIMDHTFCREAGIDPTGLRFEEHIASERLVDLFREIEHYYTKESTPCRIARLRLLALSMLIELREKHTLSAVAGIADTAMHQNVKNAIQYIRLHEGERLSLDSIAHALYINKYVLARQFKTITRQTVVQYIHSYRCHRAHALLQEGATVTEAARQCGFANLSFFAKTFQRYIGSLPSACRKR